MLQTPAPRLRFLRGRSLFERGRGGRVCTAVLRDATHRDEVVSALGYEHLRRHAVRRAGLTWMADAGVPVHHPI